MSGQQIGTVVGGVIGAFFGNPQLGAMIGGYIGGVIDPTVIKGPSIGDAQQQTSQAGRPIPRVLGHSPPIAGTVVDGDPIARKITIRNDGKGSTTVTEQEGFIATRLFLVCESPDGDANIARIRRNGKLVYSTVEGDDLDEAESAAFASQVTILRGGDDQLPHPALEALHGVGNTPYYRGVLCVLVEDDDETQTGGAANQYLFEVISSGTETESGFTCKTFVENAPWIDGAPGFRDPRKARQVYEYAYVPHGFHHTDEFVVWRDTADAALADAATATGRAPIDTPRLMGWSLEYTESPDEGEIAPWGDLTGTNWDQRLVLGLRYSRYTGDIEQAEALVFAAGGPTDGTGACSFYPEPVWAAKVVGNDGEGAIIRVNATVQQTSEAPGADVNWGCYNGASYAPNGLSLIDGYTIACRAVPTCGAALVPLLATPLPDHPGFYVGPDGTLYGGGTYNTVSGTFKQLSKLREESEAANSSLTTLPLGPVRGIGEAEYTDQAFWEAAYGEAVEAGLMPAGLTYNASGSLAETEYPQLVTTACQRTAAVPKITADAVQWRDVVTEICARAGLPASKLDIAHMTDEVPGYVLARLDLSAADYLRELCTFYRVDLVEYDGQIHAVRRGGAVVATITDDDLLEVEDDDDDDRPQTLESPGRVTIYYPDPANNYVTTPQVAERTSPDVQSSSEVNIQCTIPFDADRVAQLADVLQKVAFDRSEGSVKRSLPAEFSRLVPGDPIEVRGRRHIIRKIAYDDCMVRIEADYERASSFTSLATGAVAPTPQPPVSNLKGPTVMVAFNAPRLRTEDDTPGMYVAARGVLPGWPGCDLYYSPDGGVTQIYWGRILSAAVIGQLTGELAPGVEPLTVSVPRGELESVGAEQIAAGLNAAAVLTDEVAEVLQFQTAEETGNSTYNLTDITRGQLGTDEAMHYANNTFVLLDNRLRFVPLPISLAGKTIVWHAVTLGTLPANNATFSAVFNPQFTSPETIAYLLDEDGVRLQDEDGIYLREE